MKVLNVHRTALVRQVNEAVRSIILKADCIMNSKTEWHQAPLVTILPVSGLQEEQGTGRGSLQEAEREEEAGAAGDLGPIDQIAFFSLSLLCVLW